VRSSCERNNIPLLAPARVSARDAVCDVLRQQQQQQQRPRPRTAYNTLTVLFYLITAHSCYSTRCMLREGLTVTN